MRIITLNGNAGRDAIVRSTKNGTPCIEFSIANHEFSDGEGQTKWFNVVSYQPNCINMQKYITKGKGLIVMGRYTDRIYQTQSGACEIGRDIVATHIEFSNNGERKAEGAAQNGTSQQNIDIPMAVPTAQPEPVVMQTTVATPKAAAPATAANDDDDLPF